MALKHLASLSLLLGLGAASVARGDAFELLLPKVPATANAVVMIDVERTLASPLAQKEGWGKKLELAYVSRPIYLPPEASKLVMAAALEPNNDFLRHWEMAVMELSDPLSMRSIARSEGGYVDKIRNVEVAWTPSNAYFVSLSDRELGVVFPADRQFVSRWIGYAAKNENVMLSDYLRRATQMTNEKIQILMAIDLTDAVQPHELAEKIEDSPLFPKANLSAEEVIPLLTSLRGAVLRVAISEDAQAQLRIDFDQDVTPLAAVAQELVLQVLGNLGADVDEMQSWKTEISGKTILMRGTLSQNGQRRLFSVIELPTAKFSMLPEEAASATPELENESLVRESSLTYFRSIDVLLKDLQRDLRSGNKAVSAVLERYATKIDRMPILHVDEHLLDYGAGVSQTLRGVALSRRQGGIQSGVATAGMGGRGYGYYDYNYGVYGNLGDRYAGARQSAADRSSLKAQAMAESKQARVEGSKAVAEATAQIRRQMTQKYGVEF
jgi:hypothetical protein